MKALACVNREAEKVVRIVVNGEPGRLGIWLRQDCEYWYLCRAEVFSTAGRCPCCSLSTSPVPLSLMTTTKSSHVPPSSTGRGEGGPSSFWAEGTACSWGSSMPAPPGEAPSQEQAQAKGRPCCPVPLACFCPPQHRALQGSLPSPTSITHPYLLICYFRECLLCAPIHVIALFGWRECWGPCHK